MARRKVTTVPAPTADPGESAIYEVLTPFKFRGLIVKPPEWIELGANEAKPYQAAIQFGAPGPGQLRQLHGKAMLLELRHRRLVRLLVLIISQLSMTCA